MPWVRVCLLQNIIFQNIPIGFRNDCLLCYYCSTQSKQGTLLAERNKEDAYISRGFRSWKKASKCFEEHQQSICHKAAASYHVVKSKDIEELTNKNLLESRKLN